MKILIVGPSPTRSKGGMATVIEEIVNDEKLNKQYDIDVYESYIDGNIFVRIFYSFFAFIKFCLTKKNYDLYHVHVASRGSTFRKGLYIDVIKKWKKKVILHIHGAQYLSFFDSISVHKQKRVIEILKNADLVIALSEYWKSAFEEKFNLTNCRVLENGIDMTRLAPAIQDSRLHQEAFLALGRIGQRKGTYDLIRAVEVARKTVPNIKCYLAGDGDIDKARNLIKSKHLEDNIQVVGWANFEKKLELLKAVSTVVLPSYDEGLPMSILEGMACGKTIISTPVGAIPEVVTKENGILVPVGNVKALSEAMIRCCVDEAMMNNVSKENIEKIKNNYSMECMHKKLLAFYHDLEEA